MIEARAARLGAPLLSQGQHWHAWEERGRLVFQDETRAAGPAAPGAARRRTRSTMPARRSRPCASSGADEAAARGGDGRRLAGADAAAAPRAAGRGGRARRSSGSTAGTTRRRAQALAATLAAMPGPRWHLVCGMLNTKDVGRLPARRWRRMRRACTRSPCRRARRRSARRQTAAAAGAAGHRARRGARRARRRSRAIVAAEPDARILICGSLYLAGSVLRENG